MTLSVQQLSISFHSVMRVSYDLTAVPVPVQAQKAKALKLRKNAQKVLSASKLGASPPRKQRRLGWKPVNWTAKHGGRGGGPSSGSGTDHTEAPATSSSTQMNSSFTDRLTDDSRLLCACLHNGYSVGLAINRSFVQILLGAKLRNNLGQVVRTYVPLSPSSITWYWPRGGDALRSGR